MRQSVRIALWIILAACSFVSTTRAAGLIDRNAAARFGMARAWFTQVGSARDGAPSRTSRMTTGPCSFRQRADC